MIKKIEITRKPLELLENTTGSVDGHVGSKHNANHFKQKKVRKIYVCTRAPDVSCWLNQMQYCGCINRRYQLDSVFPFLLQSPQNNSLTCVHCTKNLTTFAFVRLRFNVIGGAFSTWKLT